MPRVQTNYFVLEICNKILMSVLWCILLIMTLFNGKISIDGIANLKKLLIMCLLDPTCLVRCLDCRFAFNQTDISHIKKQIVHIVQLYLKLSQAVIPKC